MSDIFTFLPNHFTSVPSNRLFRQAFTAHGAHFASKTLTKMDCADMKGNMLFLLGMLTLALTTPSHAGLIVIEASGQMTTTFQTALDYIPESTTISASIQFDVSPTGDPRTDSTYSNALGTFTWNDGTGRIFTLSGNARYGGGSLGNSPDNLILFFAGTGPTINGLTPSSFSIGLLLPDSLRGVSSIGNRIQQSSVQGLGFRGTGYSCDNCAQGQLTSSIGEVPAPDTFAILLLGLGGLLLARRTL